MNKAIIAFWIATFVGPILSLITFFVVLPTTFFPINSVCIFSIIFALLAFAFQRSIPPRYAEALEYDLFKKSIGTLQNLSSDTFWQETIDTRQGKKTLHAFLTRLLSYGGKDLVLLDGDRYFIIFLTNVPAIALTMFNNLPGGDWYKSISLSVVLLWIGDYFKNLKRIKIMREDFTIITEKIIRSLDKDKTHEYFDEIQYIQDYLNKPLHAHSKTLSFASKIIGFAGVISLVVHF